MERGEIFPGHAEERILSAVRLEGNQPDLEKPADARNREVTSEVPKSEVIEARPEAPEPKAFEKLPEEVQVKLLGQMLEGMRETIGGVRDYAVFASTAMYLNGEKIVANGDPAGKDLMKPPGDFDAAVFKQEDLDEIRNRMRRMPDIIFANAKKDRDGKIMRDADGEVIYDGKPGDYGTFPGQDTKILAGKRIFDTEIDGKHEQVAYDFEFFLNTKMVTRAVARDRVTESHGLRILNLEGLTDQYERNFNYELKVNNAVNEVVDYLHSDAPEVQQFKAELLAVQEDDNVALTPRTFEILRQLDVSPEDMRRVLEVQDMLDKLEESSPIPYAKLRQEGLLERYVEAQEALGNHERAEQIKGTYKLIQELISKRAALLAGTKTKLWKRDLNLLQLARLRGSRE